MKKETRSKRLAREQREYKANRAERFMGGLKVSKPRKRPEGKTSKVEEKFDPDARG
jgi:hypothetical protein